MKSMIEHLKVELCPFYAKPNHGAIWISRKGFMGRHIGRKCPVCNQIKEGPSEAKELEKMLKENEAKAKEIVEKNVAAARKIASDKAEEEHRQREARAAELESKIARLDAEATEKFV